MKKNINIPQIILALLLTAYCLLPTNLSAQTTHDFKGGEEVIPVGAAPPGPIEFKNRSRTDFYDFTVVIESQNGTPLNFSIDTVTIDGKTYNQSHNTGTFARIEADTNANGSYDTRERIPKNSGTQRTIRVTLTSYPTVPYNIRIQPTSNTASAVMVSAFSQNFGPCGTYMTHFSQEAVFANTYQGLELGEVNTTGIPLTQMLIMPQGTFAITDAFLLDPLGLPLPGGFFNPTSGMLTFPQPIFPGDTFGIQMIPDGLLANQPMMIQTCLDFPPFEEPLFQISGVDQMMMGTGPLATPTTRGELHFEYLTPMTHGEKFLNILYQPISFGDTNIYWIGQNITLDHFIDTLDISLGFDMLPGASVLPPTAPPFCNFAVILSDTIYRDITHFGTPFFSPYTFLPKEYDFGFTVPALLDTVSLPTWSPTPSFSWWGDNLWPTGMDCDMVNHDLDYTNNPGGNGANDYAGDKNACGPVATTNSFSWLRKIHPDIDAKLGAAFGPQGKAAERAMLEEFSKMMDRTHNSYTGIKDFIEAKLEFIDKYKLPMRVKYQSYYLVKHGGNPEIESPNDCYGHKADNESVVPANPAPKGHVNPKWIYDRVDEDCDTELLLQWVTIDSDGKFTYNKGHYVTVTKMAKIFGTWYLRWKDDTRQRTTDADRLRHGTSPLVVGPEGLIWIPGLTDGDGFCFIEDAIAECYDSSVKFNAVKGKAFEDSNGNGTQEPGEGGVGGVTVKLVDSTGTVVAQTKTDSEGNYVFPNPPDGDYHIEFTNLPPGYDFSPQNMGANDSTDSDVDAFGVTQPFTLNNNPQGFTDAGLIPNRVVRIKPTVFLQIPIDPTIPEMLTPLDDQELLPPTEPFTAMGMTLLPYIQDSIYREDFSSKIVDWIVVELRDANDSTIILGAVPGVLLPNGEIRGADGKPLSFHGIAHGNFFVVIRPRNGLALMTNFAIYLDATATSIDFSSPSLPIYGTDSRTQLSSGKMAITGGDGNSDGIINAADRSGAWNFRNAVGYLPWDINFDGIVNAADRSQIWNNRNKQQQLP